MPHARPGLLLVALTAVLAGCGGGGDDGSAPASEARKITKADLAAMVLPPQELGPSGEGFVLGDSSGPVDNAAAAENTVDPDDTPSSLQGAGRLSGHKLTYVAPTTVSLEKGKGRYLVGTEVELMKDTVYAAHYLLDQVNDFARLEGSVVEGVKLTRVASFDVRGIGDEAHGLKVTITRGKVRSQGTFVAFRRGRIVAAATVVRGDRKDAAEEARKLAAKLDARVQKVLAGEGEKPAAPAPGKEAKKAAVVKPKDLPALTLAATDLRPGAVAADEGRVREKASVFYYRNFVDVEVGTSHLQSLRAETVLHETPKAAARMLERLGSPAGRRAFGKKWARSISKNLGVRPGTIEVTPLAGLRKGQVGIVATWEAQGLWYRGVAVFVRSGRTTAYVGGLCRAVSFEPQDMVPVADRALELISV